MEINKAYEISNLLVDDTTSPNSGKKYLIKTSSDTKKETRVPYTMDSFINMYIGKEHIETCTTAYEELRL